ncbi:MAG: hypothetical protein OXC82_09575 [Rhodobacteraceae bacterium]|nr:hypothetical protein [Paracoccaceae bacterium]MCY4250665.1 hypothetical protein [Paracoccaceae bacterium]
MFALRIPKLLLPLSFIFLLWGIVQAWCQDNGTSLVPEPQISFEDFTEIENPKNFGLIENLGWAAQAVVYPSSLEELLPIHVYAWDDTFCSIDTSQSKYTLGINGRLNGVVLDIDSGNIENAWSSPDAYCTDFQWLNNNVSALENSNGISPAEKTVAEFFAERPNGIPLDVALIYGATGVKAASGDYVFFEDLLDLEPEEATVLTNIAFMNESESIDQSDKQILDGLSFIEHDDEKFYYKPNIDPALFLRAEHMKVAGNAQNVLGGFSFNADTPKVLLSINEISDLQQVGELWGHCQPASRFDQSSACFNADLLKNE